MGGGTGGVMVIFNDEVMKESYMFHHGKKSSHLRLNFTSIGVCRKTGIKGRVNSASKVRSFPSLSRLAWVLHFPEHVTQVVQGLSSQALGVCLVTT